MTPDDTAHFGASPEQPAEAEPPGSLRSPVPLARRTEQIEVYIGMGSNLGDRLAALQRALDRLADTPGVTIEAVSPVYQTEAHILPGAEPQPDHLNAVTRLRTTLQPHDLLGALHEAERNAGRDPEAPRWSPRPLDLDVLLWNGATFETDRLTVPHPRLAVRRFVLAPLTDLACDLVVPGLGTVVDLLASTPDRTRAERFPATLTVPEATRPERP